MDLIRLVLEDALKYTILELEIWINSKVPKRTGQLRDNLKMQLKSSSVKAGLLRLVLGTNIDYAEDVNDMTTSNVRHSGEVGYAYYYGFSGRLILSDPRAIGGFFDSLIEFARERMTVNLQKAKNLHIGMQGRLATALRKGVSMD